MPAPKKTAAPPPGYIVCPSCGGNGVQQYFEEDRPVEDACYHCNTTGYISDQQAFLNSVREAAGTLAIAAVNELRKRANSNPEGEGWAFAAAENGVREHEYTQGQVWLYEEKFMQVFGKLIQNDQFMLQILLEQLAVNNQPSTSPETSTQGS